MRRSVARERDGVEVAHDLALVGVGLRGRVRHPDVGERHLPQLGDVLDDADDAEPLAVGLDRLPDRRPAAEEPLARRVVDDRDEPRFRDVGGAVRARLRGT